MKKVSFDAFNTFLLKYDFYSQADEVCLVFYNKVNNREIARIDNEGDCYITI